MNCPTCNGWGVVYYLALTPPSTSEKRVKLRKLALKDPTSLVMRETACTTCGAYGEVPSK